MPTSYKKDAARYMWFIVRSQGDWKDKIETGFEDNSDAKDYLKEIKEYDKGAKIFHRSKVDPEKLATFFKAQGVPQRMLDKGHRDAKKDAKMAKDDPWGYHKKIMSKYNIVSDVVPINKHPNYKYKSEEGQKTDNEIVTQLQKLLHKEHLADCNDDASCDINFAAENDLWYWAIELFKSSGAASSKFKTLYNQLSPEFKKEAEAERKVMASKPHKTCKHCHSVNWGKDSDQCGQCLNPISASEGTAMSYYKRILAASAPFKGLPLGERYPRAERKLSDADIGQLDTLFHSLNRMSRDDKKWGETCSKINKLLGFECVGETSDGLMDDEADSALMTESDKFKKYGPIVKVFKSSSNPNKSYEVRQLKGQDPTCNCRGWATHRKCKHVDEVKRLHLHPVAASVKDAIADLLSNYNESSVDARSLKPKDAVADLLSRYMGKRAEAVAHLANKITSKSKAVTAQKYTILKDDDDDEVVDEKRLKEYAQNMYDANVDDESPPPHKKVTTVEQAIKNIEWAGEDVEPYAGKYTFIVDMDERGTFSCHVDDEDDNTVWSASTDDNEDGEFSPVVDGFMKHTKDIKGLEKYLKDLKIIPKDASLVKGN